MFKVFLSKKHEETDEAKLLKSYLESCFIECWLDLTNLLAGASLNQAFYDAIREYSIFIPLITEMYLDSTVCRLEFDYAHEQQLKGRCRVIPTTMGDRQKILEKAEKMKWHEMVRTVESAACVGIEASDKTAAYTRIANAIQYDSPVIFTPITYLTVEGKNIQRIEYRHRDHITFDIFQSWKINFSKFFNHTDESLPIKNDLPVAIWAQGVNWLPPYFALQFSNKHEIYIYNKPANQYLCVYARSANNNLVGTILNG